MSEPQTIGERKILEGRRAVIVRYIMDHPNCTKADVIRYMKGRSAVRTTHTILVTLIKENKIKMQKKHSQTHLLNVNNDNRFIKLYTYIDRLYRFTDEATRYVHRSNYQFYKTKPPLKYEGIDGFENSFRQLFNMMPQVLYRGVVLTQSNEINDADRRLLLDRIEYLYFHLAIHHWDEKTTREVIDMNSENIKQFFGTLNKEKNRLVKMMERHEIDKLNKYTEFGNKLLEVVDKFKKEYRIV